MPHYVPLHLGLYCLLKYPFRGFPVYKGSKPFYSYAIIFKILTGGGGGGGTNFGLNHQHCPYFVLRAVKALMRLYECAGWFEHSLSAHRISTKISCLGSFENLTRGLKSCEIMENSLDSGC